MTGVHVDCYANADTVSRLAQTYPCKALLANRVFRSLEGIPAITRKGIKRPVLPGNRSQQRPAGWDLVLGGAFGRS